MSHPGHHVRQYRQCRLLHCTHVHPLSLASTARAKQSLGVSDGDTANVSIPGTSLQPLPRAEVLHTLSEPRLSLGRLDGSLGCPRHHWCRGRSVRSTRRDPALRVNSLPPAPSHPAAANLLGPVHQRSLRRECGSYSSAALMLAWTSPSVTGLVNRGQVKPQSAHDQNSTPAQTSGRSWPTRSRPLHARHSPPITVPPPSAAVVSCRTR